jgi:hypothetical protein
MTDLVLNAAPLFAMVRPRLEAFGLRLTQAIDAFAEARMRNGLPARLLQAELERDRGNAAAPRPAGVPAGTGRCNPDLEGEPHMLVLINTIALAIGRTLAGAASLLSRLQGTVAQARAERARVEAELFQGRYHLSSKNDDDLPLVR